MTWTGLAGWSLFNFLKFNLRHYALALWGVRLQLEPDYPVVTRFFPALIRDSVFEWRTYGAMLPWSIVVITALPRWLVGLLLIFWGVQSFIRAGHFQTNYIFWKQAYWECPHKPRVQTEYCAWIIRETERRMKTGHGFRSPVVQALDREAFRLQEEICRK